ncbi:MAG: hypothetical protein RML56_02745 [Burkholderiales bacterium]|nr:hypothetical protein [Burkholderiales bacterium]
MTLKRKVEHGVEQRMPGAHEGSKRRPRRRDQRLLERDALVARKHRLARADLAVAVAYRGRHVQELVAARLALARDAPKAPEGLKKEGLDVVRLKAAGLGALHLFAHARHTACVHRIVRERAFFEQVPDTFAVHRVLDRSRKARAHLRTVSVADRLDHQLA